MVITDRFVYIHMPKTGGTFVEAALQRLLAGSGGLYIDTATEVGRKLLGLGRDQHQTVSEIPAEFSHLPIAFTIRNPFDQHVSLFEFEWWKTHPGDTFDEPAIRAAYPQYPAIDFGEYLRAFYDLRLLDPGYISGPLAERIEALGIGPLTYEYIRFLFQRPSAILDDLHDLHSSGRIHALLRPIHFVRQESLDQSLVDFLVSVGYSPQSVEFVLTMGRVYPDETPRRTSRDWRSYYSPELMRLVRDREWLLFSLFPEYDPG